MPRPDNLSLGSSLAGGEDEDGCFYMNPYRETPEYRAYEQFSLVVGLLTLGDFYHTT